MIQNSLHTPLEEKTGWEESSGSSSAWSAPFWSAAVVGGAWLLRRQLFKKRTLWMLAGIAAAEAMRRQSVTSSPNVSRIASKAPLRGLVKSQATFTIKSSPEQLYRMFTDIENAPQWQEDLVSVERVGENRSKWRFELPGGIPLEWISQTTAEEPGKRYAWKSVPGSVIEQAGQITFEEAVTGRGTVVRLTQEFLLPGGKLGAAFGGLLARTPGGFVRENLRHFKQLAEAGEIPTTVGQPHGTRSFKGNLQRMVLGEQNLIKEPQLNQAGERQSA